VTGGEDLCCEQTTAPFSCHIFCSADGIAVGITAKMPHFYRNIYCRNILLNHLFAKIFFLEWDQPIFFLGVWFLAFVIAALMNGNAL
jgi:hypothetical protein